MRVRVSLLVCALVTIPGSMAGQSSAPCRNNVFSVHPAGYETSPNLALEYERRIAPSVTLGLTAQLGLLSREHDRRIQAASVEARYFFSGDAWRGLSLGASVGSRQAPNFFSYRQYNQPSTTPRTTTALLVDYHWLVGTQKRLYLGLGTGLEATWRSREARVQAGTPLARPTGRVSIGVAF
jgi:hypothetical protein